VSGTTLEIGAAPLVSDERGARLKRLSQMIEHAGHLLPAQGPITVFIHHNTLHAFEELPFVEAVKQGGALFGCHPFLPEEHYRARLAEGRIRTVDLEAVLRNELGESAGAPILTMGSRLSLRLAMLEFPLRQGPADELRWFVAETDALTRMRRAAPLVVREQLIADTRRWILVDLQNGAETQPPAAEYHHRARQMLAGLLRHFCAETAAAWDEQTWEAFTVQALWRVCREGVHGIRTGVLPEKKKIRHRDILLTATGADSDLPVHELLIRFCAAFLDQGFAPWSLPSRDQGFFQAFCNLYGVRGSPPELWMRGLPGELRRLQSNSTGPLESILESLALLGVAEPEWEDYLGGTLLALRGWAGMVRQVEIRGDSVAHPIPAGSLIEFLAIQLVLERFALAHLARESLGFDGPLRELRSAAGRLIPPPSGPTVEQHAFQVFQLAQVLGWAPDQLHRLTKVEWGTLAREIEGFTQLDRRRVFHLAFERRYRTQTLDALSVHSRRAVPRAREPGYQVICCLDEREESFRRHLEELSADVETFGAAGFFSVPMYYQGVADAHFVPLCPVMIRPKHWVTERVVYSLEQAERRRSRTRRALGQASHQVHVGSRTIAKGTLLTAGLGILASVPLVARILFPRLTARIRQGIGVWVAPPRMTQLHLERVTPAPGPEEDRLGFNVDEMATSAERLLRDIGLTSELARLVLIAGHGSSSLNNPHNSAYNCGACGGSCGGPNARALAQMLNDSRVRFLLAERGLNIPVDTVFVGAWHNTCNDAVTYFDLDRLPPLHREEFESLSDIVDAACDRNAHERCRRFQSAPLALSISEARRHVEERSEDLAQTRPECGHATNAVCLVGRRSRSSGLFMDRRSFLVSYDATQDDEETSILTRILQAVFPVCSGINLEYYFSYVDSAGWGCGTKLPHNVTALLGVMDGAASDLRTGLPWQMVEIHEPVRLLFVIETTPEALERILEKNPPIATLCRNGWVQLAVLDPHSDAIQLFQGESFLPYQPETTDLPKVRSSAEWYRGQRDHLGFAEIEHA
jgi:uncharacterized protein